MSGFEETWPDVVVPAPDGPDDPLGGSVLDPAHPGLRVFEPREVRIVIGRNQDPHREVLVDAARAAGVPIHRRLTGGGTVVLAPGMVVLAVRLAAGVQDPNAYFAAVNAATIPALRALGVEASCRGHGDLTVAGEDGVCRKVLGTSLRQTSRLAAYLGVFLVDDAVPLMERLLPMPSKQPDYRAGRGHRAFCDHLGRQGVTTGGLIAALTSACATLVDRPPVTGACTV